MGKEMQAIPQTIRKQLGHINKSCWSEIKDYVYHSGALVYFDAKGNPVGCKVDGTVYGKTSSNGKFFRGNDGEPQSSLVNSSLKNTYEDLPTAKHDHGFIKPGHTTKRGKHAQVTRDVLRETRFVWNHETNRRRTKLK